MGRRAMKTISQPAAISSLCILNRTASRIRRLIWFRFTALPVRRPTAKPNRLCSRSLGRTDITNRGWSQVLPSRRMRTKSELARKRYFLRIAALAQAELPQARHCLVSHGQLVTAPAPSPLQDGLPALGLHPRPKSVLSFPTPDLRLPGSFRHGVSSLVRFTARDYTWVWLGLQVCGGR